MILVPTGDNQIDEQKFKFRGFDTDIHETKQFFTWKLASPALLQLWTYKPQHGWYYVSCSICNNKLQQADTSMYCNKCKEYNNVGLISYRFEMRVRDRNGDVGTFVVLNGEATKIAGKNARDVLNECIEAAGKDNYEGIKTTIPECLKHIIGCSCKFQIKLTKYNFNTSRQTITISRIIDTQIASLSELGEENSEDGDVECKITATREKNARKPETTKSAASNGNKDKRSVSTTKQSLLMSTF
ncbi:putative nucleic acid-binding, replication factor A [Arabidopsis thaliana]